MPRLLLASLTLALAASAHAAPSSSTSLQDDLDRLMADRGFIGKLESARHTAAERASDLVVTAMGFLGVPYRWGGSSAETGFDCSGFVRAMYGQTIGKLLPRRADEQAASTQTIAKSELKPGDLVFFNTMRRAFSHVGIYVGDGKFIHAPRSGATIRVEDMHQSYWSRRFDGARRVMANEADESGAAAIR
jgi:cell wall-associated NlpC family hydrolase